MGPWFRFSYTEVNKTGACIRQRQQETKGDEGHSGSRGRGFYRENEAAKQGSDLIGYSLSDRLAWERPDCRLWWLLLSLPGSQCVGTGLGVRLGPQRSAATRVTPGHSLLVQFFNTRHLSVHMSVFFHL